MYRYETHFHTSESSPCSRLSAAEGLSLYKAAGYSGVNISDHYDPGFFLRRTAGLSTFREQADAWLKGYRAAKKAGEAMGMSVFLGMELCTEESSNDYLLFGVTEDFVYDNPRLYEWSMADVCRLAKRYGILVFQAHPYRAGLMFTPGVLDGVEVCNANPRENSQNHLALAASLEHSLLQSSGSDCHRPEDVGRGGIQTDRPLTTAQQFRDIFLSGSYTLITPAN